MVASRSARSTSGASRSWVNVGLAAWLIGGVYLVARGSWQGVEPDVAVSPYAVPAYAGLGAAVIYLVWLITGSVRRSQPWRSAFTGGYEYLPVGVAMLVAYIVLDVAWRGTFGIGFGIEGALAPTRLLLAIGLGLVAVGPARAVLEGSAGASKLAGTIAIALALGPVSFPVETLHPLVGDYAERPSTASEDDSEIWLMAADGTAQTRIIAAGDGIEASLPVWSPDGSRIAYTRWSPLADGGATADIWVAEATGRGAAALTSGNGVDWIPAWSPDGEWIAYTAEPEASQPATGESSAEGPRPGGPPGAGPPQRETAQTWVVHPDGSGRHQLTNVERGALGAAWSPDGARLVFNNDRTGDSEIYVIDVDGSNERRLTNDPAEEWAPAWSPDGTRILFTSTRTGDNEIWMVGVDGSGLTRLTSDPGDDEVPVWSPDGRRIAFVSTRTGDAEIWTMAPDGSDLTNLTRRPSAADGRWSVHWSPDGSSILYASAGLGPAAAQPIVLEDLAVAGALLAATALAIAAMVAVSIGLPFGAVTIVVTIDSILAATISDLWRLVPAFILVGLIVDLVLRRTPAHRRRRLAAVLTPAGIVLGYGLTLAATGSLAWTPTLLVGTSLAAGLVGWLIGTLLPASEPR